MEFIIRSASPGDTDAVYGLICELEQRAVDSADFALFTTVYQQNCQDPQIRYLVVESGGRVIGFGSVHIQRLLHHFGPVAEVQELIVKQECRGAGIGSALVRALEAEAKAYGCALIEVCCNRKREASNEFYGCVGFSKTHFKHTKIPQ